MLIEPLHEVNKLNNCGRVLFKKIIYLFDIIRQTLASLYNFKRNRVGNIFKLLLEFLSDHY